MKLLIDLGNSSIRLATATDAGIELLHAGCHAQSSLTPVLMQASVPAAIDSVHVANVAASSLTAQLDAWLLIQGLPAARYARSGASACGVSNSYAEPQRLGVDRWLAVIAAHQRAAGAACVVDAGTALTVDVVAADGQHVGGLIAPGIHSQRRSMQAGTGQVRPRDYPEDLQLLGHNSEQALAWGSVHAVLGLIERVAAELASAHEIQHWYLTGGEAPMLAPHLSAQWQAAPLLVLEGLAHVAAGEAVA